MPMNVAPALALLLASGSVQAAPDTQTVIGGEPSPTCAWPTTVSLGGCTGTLIHPEIVVYAAHCGADIPSVWFGEQAFSGPGRNVPTAGCFTNQAYFDGPGERHEDWAFCRLAEPVHDVPIVPPLMGCETTLLTPGREVTVVGFGLDENDDSGTKRQGVTQLQWITEDGAVLAGNGEVGSCYGDSGGPIYIQLPDESWRVFGIVSGGQACGFPAWYATVHTAIPTIEEETGIDVTPCHYTGGGWNPSPACGNAPIEPWNGSGKTWADGCAGGPVVSEVATCGPSFDDALDEAGPEATIIEPAWGDVFESDADSGFASVDIEVEAADLPSGVERVGLRINGELVDGGLDRDPPFRWGAVALPSGVWELSAVATDWAGNETVAAAVMIGVDEQPPAMPKPEGSTGADDGSTGDPVGGTGADDGSTGDAPVDGTSSGTGTPVASSSSSGAGADGTSQDAGCGCTSSGSGGGAAWLWLIALGLGRRRRVSLALGALLSTAGCDDDGDAADDDEATGNVSSSSSGGELPASTSTTDASGSTGDESTSTGLGVVEGSTGSGSSSTTESCEPGTEGCTCTADAFSCGPDLRCELNTCIPCPAGTQSCNCVPPETDGEEGTCERGLLCVDTLCAAPPPCPFVRNGVCDEGGGTCFEGSDVFDCCPTMPGVCEEVSAGGKCPEGSDADDCVKEPPKG
ncbi:MAG: trypsin-like serine protease [Nannocystaceae bacterium]|nr:trypsin-like serine protease [bacterium]